MKFISICSGIEAASVAWSPLGWEAVAFSEIEPFPSAVLAHHYPDVPNLGDMLTLPERILALEAPAPDLLCGGTPCQAFSVAGNRRSLEDARGNLSLTFCEIANAIDDVRASRGEPSCIVFWENVPGVLNTPDNAFGCFLAGIAGETEPLVAAGGKWTNAGCVYGPKRAVAWRVFDAQYFGVAQRRRRVFLVASARDGFDPSEILFEREGMRRNLAPSREAGQEVAGTIAARFGISRNNHEECVTASRMVAFGEYVDDGTASAMKARDYKDATDLVVQPVYTIQGSMIGRNDHAGPKGNGINEDVCFTQNTTDRHAVVYGEPIPIHDQATRFAGKRGENQDGKGNGLGIGEPGAPMNTLTKGDRHAVAYEPLPFDTTQITSPSNYSKPQAGDPCHPLAAGAHPPAIAQPMVLMDQGGSVMNVMEDGTVGTLRRETHGHEPSVLTNMAVRRLTPVECERLQGFPDDYTNIPWRKQPTSPDGPRYKALGNSWAVPNVRWIGARIDNYLKQLSGEQK